MNEEKSKGGARVGKAARIINNCKASSVIQGITYKKLSDEFSIDIFTENALRGKLGINAIEPVNSRVALRPCGA